MAKRPATARATRAEQATALAAVDGDATAPLALDRIIHERVRLAIVSALAARKLEEAGYLTCRKYFEGRVPRTEYRLTQAGKKALERYLGHMEALIKRVGG